jgi:hypothetical protein
VDWKYVGSGYTFGEVTFYNSFFCKANRSSAHAMSKRFPGSVVLQQNSEGVSRPQASMFLSRRKALMSPQHVCISSPSVCTYGHVRNYFQTSDLPAAGTVCQPDQLPFGHMTASGDDLSGEDEISSLELRNEKGL